MNTVDVSHELFGVYHPLALALIDYFDKHTDKVNYRTRLNNIIDIKLTWPDKLIGRIVLIDNIIMLFRDSLNAWHISGNGWKGYDLTKLYGKSHLYFDIGDPVNTIEHIGNMIIWCLDLAH